MDAVMMSLCRVSSSASNHWPIVQFWRHSPRRRLREADLQCYWSSGTGSHVVPAVVAPRRG